MLISSKTTLCQGCFQTFGGQCIYLFIYFTVWPIHYIVMCFFYDNNLKVKFLVILLFFSFFISLSSRSFTRAVSLWVDLVCIRHFSLSAVLCLILTHWEPCQPKQETYYCYCTLSHTHTHSHTLSPTVKSLLPCLSMVRGMVVWSLSSSLSSCSYMKPVSHTLTIMFWEGQGNAVKMLCKQKHLF